ncbi:6507_t:CDS:1 [Racocetra fulgida]|uniref:6507_t:CDS:1 n=1 Tax=Racocetra fulgida TaxID=60492 RepID=A0A9N8W602_9GLOM|nr:6507_t:CDS:1 [Racocetra fulgida]
MPSKLTCILYLEPAHSSQFYQSILKFYDQSLKLFGPNNAHQYDPHISMTGFFTLYDNQKIINDNINANHDQKECISAYEQLDQIIQFIDNFLHNHKITYPLVKDILYLKPTSLLIPLQVCQAMLDLVNQLSCLSFEESNSNITTSDNGIKTIIRPKAIDHLSLAYSRNGFVSNNKMMKLKRLANKIIAFDEAKQQKCGWDIVIYEELEHSTKLEDKHVFKEVKRWNIF